MCSNNCFSETTAYVFPFCYCVNTSGSSRQATCHLHLLTEVCTSSDLLLKSCVSCFCLRPTMLCELSDTCMVRCSSRPVSCLLGPSSASFSFLLPVVGQWEHSCSRPNGFVFTLHHKDVRFHLRAASAKWLGDLATACKRNFKSTLSLLPARQRKGKVQS